jgi:2-oxoglutarate ferredoxin oxidoreductase subunit beta
MNAPAKADGLTRRDFVSDQSVRWCPGCGDYAILAQIQKTLPELGVPRENIVFLSGIGCSSRFPYYMNTYGIHSIHGRAPTLATGLKCARPELQIWVTTGDGDALAIGGNHLLHALRRNIDINIVLFNNRIYGLTKGQYSPTSEIGKRTKSSPDGSIENPVNPIGVAIGSEAGFIARTVDSFQEHMAGVLRRAARHTGAALIEVAQNCMIFNDGAWAHLTNPNTKADNVLFLEHGKPMRFGKAMEKGIHLNGFTPEVVNVADVDERALLVHNESATEPTLAYFLSRMGPPDFPTPVGIFRAVEKPVYDQQLMAQVQAAQESYPADLDALYRQSETWAVPAIALEGTKCPLCDHPNLPGADECELCLASLTQEEASAAEANSRIEQSLREDSVEKLNPAGAVSVPESATVTTALEVMRGKRIGCVLITNTEGNLIGIFTERDALTRVAGEDLDPADTVVGEVMTRDPETVKLEHPLAHAVHLMVVGDLRYLPLVDKDGCPSGIIGSRDLINHIASLAMNWVTHG